MKMKQTNLKAAFLAIASCGMLLLASCGGNSNQNQVAQNDSIPNDTIPMDTLGGGTNCMSNLNCNNTGCQDSIVSLHSIPRARFDSMTASYGTPASFTSYTVAQINTMMSGLNCTQGDCLSYTNLTGSTPLVIAPWVTGSTATIDGKISIAFINGVKRLYSLTNNDVLEFYKAKNAANTLTVCMRAIRRGTAVFWSDHSNIYP